MYCKFCKEIFEYKDRREHNQKCESPNNYYKSEYADEIKKSIPKLNVTTRFEMYRQSNNSKSEESNSSDHKMETQKDFDSKSDLLKKRHRSCSPKSDRKIRTREDFDSKSDESNSLELLKKRRRSRSPKSDRKIRTREDSYTRLEQHLLGQIKMLENELEQIKYTFIYAKFEYDTNLQKQEAKNNKLTIAIMHRLKIRQFDSNI